MRYRTDIGSTIRDTRLDRKRDGGNHFQKVDRKYSNGFTSHHRRAKGYHDEIIFKNLRNFCDCYQGHCCNSKVCKRCHSC